MADQGKTVQALFDLWGKVALVTGGVTGLGWQASEALAEAGATVVMTSRSEARAQEAAARLRETTGQPCEGAVLEASDAGAWRALVDGILERHGRIDILVNNAGGRKVSKTELQTDFAAGFLEGRPLEDWQYSLDVMLTGPFIGCQTVAPIMKTAGYGKIINIASIDGIRGRDLRIYENSGLSPTVPDYLAAKAGLINLTRALAVVLAPYGVRVNSISPGGFQRGQPQAFVDHYAREVPLGRMGDDRQDLKGAVLFAAAPASDYMVGHNLVIDGGFTAW